MAPIAQRTTMEMSYEQVMQDPDMAQAFLQFLHRQYCAETFHFIQLVNRYKALKSDPMTAFESFKLQMSIIENYIRLNSDQELNITPDLRDSVIEQHSELGMQVPSCLFDQIECYCHAQLKNDQHKAFLDSDIYQESLRRRMKKDASSSSNVFRSLKKKFLASKDSAESPQHYRRMPSSEQLKQFFFASSKVNTS